MKLIYKEINKKRKKNGIPPLKVNKDIEGLIQSKGCPWYRNKKLTDSMKQFLGKLGFEKAAKNSGSFTNLEDWERVTWIKTLKLRRYFMRKDYSNIGCSALKNCRQPNKKQPMHTFSCIYT